MEISEVQVGKRYKIKHSHGVFEVKDIEEGWVGFVRQNDQYEAVPLEIFAFSAVEDIQCGASRDGDFCRLQASGMRPQEANNRANYQSVCPLLALDEDEEE